MHLSGFLSFLAYQIGISSVLINLTFQRMGIDKKQYSQIWSFVLDVTYMERIRTFRFLFLNQNTCCGFKVCITFKKKSTHFFKRYRSRMKPADQDLVFFIHTMKSSPDLLNNVKIGQCQLRLVNWACQLRLII